MVCRATTGGNAPDLGMRVETDSGLTGACLATGEVQQCSDTESDPRVNAEACRTLGVRSMLILPLCDRNGPFGILEVLSAQPYAFANARYTFCSFWRGELRRAREGRKNVPPSQLHPTVPKSPPAKSARHKIRNLKARRSWHPKMVGGLILGPLCWSFSWLPRPIALGIAIGWRGAANGRKSTSHPRTVAPSAASAIDRWLRLRSGHPSAQRFNAPTPSPFENLGYCDLRGRCPREVCSSRRTVR